MRLCIRVLYALSSALVATTAQDLHQGHKAPFHTQLVYDFPDPNFDPFYQVPSNISFFTPGQVIRSRQVLTTVSGRSVKSYQAYYRTVDNKDDAIGTVTTIWIPSTPAFPPKVFSYQQAEDALNLDCAPSWAWVNTSSVTGPGYYLTSFVIPWALQQGYYVVVSDSEGPDSAWLVGLTEGRATLDGIRAAIKFLRLPDSETQVMLFGYSGGGHTSAWASSLAEQYAPELRIAGAAFGGTPVDLQSAYELLNGSPDALLGGGAIVGLANGYPELNKSINSFLNPTGLSTVSTLRLPNNCINVIAPTYANIDFDTLFTRPPLGDPVLQKVLARESLLSNVSSIGVPVPKFPRYQWHGTGDSVVPYPPEELYVQQQCAGGADIRFITLPGLDHGPAFTSGVVGALQFVQQAFNANLTKVTCGANISVPAIGSAAGLDLLGVDNNILLTAMLSVGSKMTSS